MERRRTYHHAHTSSSAADSIHTDTRPPKQLTQTRARHGLHSRQTNHKSSTNHASSADLAEEVAEGGGGEGGRGEGHGGRGVGGGGRGGGLGGCGGRHERGGHGGDGDELHPEAGHLRVCSAASESGFYWAAGISLREYEAVEV